jgi:hypothetical protein
VNVILRMDGEERRRKRGEKEYRINTRRFSFWEWELGKRERAN